MRFIAIVSVATSCVLLAACASRPGTTRRLAAGGSAVYKTSATPRVSTPSINTRGAVSYRPSRGTSAPTQRPAQRREVTGRSSVPAPTYAYAPARSSYPATAGAIPPPPPPPALYGTASGSAPAPVAAVAPAPRTVSAPRTLTTVRARPAAAATPAPKKQTSTKWLTFNSGSAPRCTPGRGCAT